MPAMERLLPLMFHRRLALLMGVVAFIALGLGVQLVRLTVVEGAQHRSVAESRLATRTFLPTTRGRILDRHGRVLASDAPTFDIAVDYGVLIGEWEFDHAYRAALRANRERWEVMSPEERVKAYVRHRPGFEEQVERLWQEIIEQGNLSRAELEARRQRIKERVELMAGEVWGRQRAEELMQFRRSANDEDALDAPSRDPIREQRMPHVLLHDVDERIAFHFRRLADELPGVHVMRSKARQYPWLSAQVSLDRTTLPRPLRSAEPTSIVVTGVADHIIGSMRAEVWAVDIARRPFRTTNEHGESIIDPKGYLPGDSVGLRGLEQVYEDHLRGTRGVVHRRKNTGEEDVIDPIPGSDLHLSIDIDLQATIQAIMSPQFGLMVVHQWQAGWNTDGLPKPTQFPIGTPLNGAAVVVDVDSAEILAMVTMPTIAMGESWTAEEREFLNPFINRAIEAPYPPGSIIKPIVLAAAVGEGVHRLDHRIDCTGHYFPNWKDRARCWIYREVYHFATHNDQFGGPLDARQALAVSCNCYFYTLADELGGERLLKWYQQFGMGRRLHVGLAHHRHVTGDDGVRRQMTVGEYPGSVPIGADGRADPSLTVFDTVIMGIGMGRLDWTPLHAANAYATLARHGYVRDATLIHSGPRSSNRRSERDLGLDPRVVESILAGLHDSIYDERGTGHHIRYEDRSTEQIISAEGVIVWAKTGTATVAVRASEPDPDSESEIATSDVRRLDHAWFVGLVGDDQSKRPRYAIAVLVEYGGSGGRVAGPIANQIIEALKRLKYL